MFVLADLKDTVRIPPHLFHIAETDAIKNEINRKLANKVMIDVGLCIAMHSIVDLGDSLLLPCDGSFHTDVRFRYIVFRPTLQVIVIGKIRSCSREGVHVTLGFFDDILIPAHLLQYPVRFEEAEQAWVWEYPLDAQNKHDLYMDIGESIKFRVVREIFEECSPVGPAMGHKESSTAITPVSTEIKIPYRIVGAINEPGLGVLSWWDQHNNIGVEEDDEEEELEDNGEYKNNEPYEIEEESQENEQDEIVEELVDDNQSEHNDGDVDDDDAG